MIRSNGRPESEVIVNVCMFPNDINTKLNLKFTVSSQTVGIIPKHKWMMPIDLEEFLKNFHLNLLVILH